VYLLLLLFFSSTILVNKHFHKLTAELVTREPCRA